MFFSLRSVKIEKINDRAIALKYHEYSTNKTNSSEFNKNEFKKELLTFYKVPDDKSDDFESILKEIFHITKQRVSRKRMFFHDEQFKMKNDLVFGKKKSSVKKVVNKSVKKEVQKTNKQLLGNILGNEYLDQVVKRMRNMKSTFGNEEKYKGLFEKKSFGIGDICNLPEADMSDFVSRSFQQQAIDMINEINQIKNRNDKVII